MIDSLPRCNQCHSPVTDNIEIEIEYHGRVKMGENIRGSWVCNDCVAKRTSEVTSTIQDDTNHSVHHEHIGVANKSDVSPNTPTAEEDNLNSKLTNE